MIVAGQHRNASARLPIPDANGLIVGGAQNPRIFVMEECRSDVIQMTEQCEDAAAFFVIPELKFGKTGEHKLVGRLCYPIKGKENRSRTYLDFEIITARNEQRLLIVETNASNGSIMLIKLLQQSAHAIVPQLDDTAMQTAIDLWERKLMKIFCDVLLFQRNYLAKIHGRFR